MHVVVNRIAPNVIPMTSAQCATTVLRLSRQFKISESADRIMRNLLTSLV